MDQRYFLNEKLPTQRSIQTVGATTSQANLHRVLIPVNNQNHSHYMTHTLAVEKIIDPIPYKDMKNVMNKAYDSYVHSMVGSGAVPLPHSQWPNGLMGGPVDFLLGVSDLNFKLIFNFYGLIFISHNLKATRCVAVGGSFNQDSFQQDQENQILNLSLRELNPHLGDESLRHEKTREHASSARGNIFKLRKLYTNITAII